jgi:alpha-ribazole phosphatase
MWRVSAWRHPRPHNVSGVCVGCADVSVDPRKARRLARRIHRTADREGMPRLVCSSPLRRCRDVTRHLRRLGWRVFIDPDLLEMDFGEWNGRPWHDIPRAKIEAWVRNFAEYAPGGGESLARFLVRAVGWVPPLPEATVVAHAGWMLARQWALQHGPGMLPRADQWPVAPSHGQCWRM